MARYRWTLALIIVSLTILVTVITAFRVRELPRSSHENLKVNSRKQHKCDGDCDVNDFTFGQKIHSVKIESAKRSYDDVKKVVLEKQKSTTTQTPEIKSGFRIKHDSEDDDDDDNEDDLDYLKSKMGFRSHDQSKVVEKGKAGLDKSDVKGYKFLTLSNDIDDNDDDNDDEDGDNEDDNDEDDAIGTSFFDNIKILEFLANKLEPIKSQDSKASKPTEQRPIDDGDEDDDEDNDDSDNYINLHKPLLSKMSVKERNIEKSPSVQKHILKDNVEYSPRKAFKLGEKTDGDARDKRVESKPKVPVKLSSHIDSKVENKKSEQEKKDLKTSDAKYGSVDEVKTPIEPIKISSTKKEEIKLPKDIKSIKEKSEKDTKVDSVKKDKENIKQKLSSPKERKIEDHEESKKKEQVKRPEKKITAEPKKPDEKQKQVIKEEGKKHIKKESKKDFKIEMKDETSKEMLVGSQEIFSKSDSHLKPVTDALHRRNLLQSEFEDFYAFLPTFAPNFSRIHNPECRRHGQILLRQLRGTKLWALNMLDATAKIPTGILQGNGIQLGDFDQCLGSHARVQLDTGSVVKVQGKYCLARLDVKAEQPELEVPVYLAQAKNLFKSRIDDPGHFVPRFSTLSWGVCVPSACNPEDVEVVIKDAIKHYQHKSGLVIRIKVDPQDCHTQEKDWWEAWSELPTIITLSFYAVIILLVLVATVQDFVGTKTEGQNADETSDKAKCEQKDTKVEEKRTKKQKDGFLNIFSLYQTISKLTAPGTTDEISCIHGVRAIATIALLLAHKFLPIAVTPYTNRLKITEVVSSPLWSWCRAGWMFTDCFLLLSGTLTAYRITVDSESSAPKRLLLRYLRLTPALLAIVLFYAYVWDNISSGPMWGTLVTKNAEVCQEGWWWNLLYVQNYFGFEDMCAPQTHQLALDMQLTLIGCLIVWGSQVNPGLFRVLLPGIHVLAAYSRYTTVRDHRLTMLAYHGVSVSQLYRTARLSYTSTFHRSTAYLVGVSLGLILQKPSHHNYFFLTFGWFMSAALWGLVWWAGFDSGSTNYHYSVTFAAQYAALAPIASAIAIAWVIYAVHSGNCDFLARFLCWRPLVLVSRLSYALYLTQFIIFLTNAATVKSSSEFSIMSMINIQEISAIILSATILTLTFVIPMQSLPKIFILSSTDTQEKTEIKEESVSQIDDKKQLQSDRNVEGINEAPYIRRQNFIAHREVLEEIPEGEVEYEAQRETIKPLQEILEEDDVGEEEMELHRHLDDDELEIIEEEQGGEEEFWEEREEYAPRRSYPIEDDQDLDEWEWTVNGNGRNGAQHYRYTR